MANEQNPNREREETRAAISERLGQGQDAPGAGAAYGEGEHDEESLLSSAISIGGPNHLERALFCRQFAMLIEVGIPVMRALQMLQRRTSNRRLQKAVAATARGVESGQPIYQAMQQHERVFSSLVVNIVRIGETGGILQDSLNRLADIMEGKARMKRQIISATMYPFVALLVALFVIGIIMVKAIPIFADVYKSAGRGDELPEVTKMVIAISSFLSDSWIWLIVIVIGVIIGWRIFAQTTSGKRFLSVFYMRTPILRGINQKIAVARMSRTLGGLYTAGVPLVDALAITADTSENTMMADALRRVHGQVEKGERMAEPLGAAHVIPPLVVDMIAVGEETGTIEQMLVKVSDIYDDDVRATLNGLASIIEPLLIVVLGGLVIFIAAAVLFPYFNLASII